MKNILIVLMALTCGFAFSDAEASKKSRDRIEQLFIWKVSDSMNLSDDEESKLSEALSKVNKQKHEASERLASLVGKMDGKQLQEDKARKILSEYKEALNEYYSCQETELKLVEEILGTTRIGQYIVIKHQFSDRLKSVLSQNATSDSQSKSKKLKDPSIIEE